MHEICRIRSKVKVKVTGLLKFRKLHFSKSISSAIYNWCWQMSTNSWTTAQCLNLIMPDFCYLSYFLCHVTLNLEGSLQLVLPQKSFFGFQWNLMCRDLESSISDAWWYAVWHDSRSRSRSWVLESHSRGVDRQSRTRLIFYNRLHIGHARLTYSYLIDCTDPPECTNCH